MASAPIFVGTPKNGAASNIATVSTVVTAGASGARIDRIIIQSNTGSAGGTVNLYIDVGGTNYLLESFTKAASATWTTESSYVTPTKPLILGAGNLLEIECTGGDTIDCVTSGGDY